MSSDPRRQPAVAGSFYPGSGDVLERQVRALFPTGRPPEKAIGAVMPHAGYVYSGAVAGETACAIRIPSNVILLGPNHTGIGPGVSVYPGGTWQLPFGDVPVNSTLAALIVNESELAVPDETAHAREHSLEVLLPFLYYAADRDLSFVPITLSRMSRDECRMLGEALARVLSAREEEILIVSSSDMTHYESQESARTKDTEAISRVLAMDPDGLLEVVNRRQITMCGVIPTSVMLYAAISLGATKAKLIRYATSGDVSGDYNQVVGYAGIIVN